MQFSMATRDSLQNIVMQDPQIIPTTQFGSLDGAQNLRSQRLSLCTRSETPCIISVPVLPCEYPNLPSLGVDGFRMISCKGDGHSQTKMCKNSENIASDLPGNGCDTIVPGILNVSQGFLNSREEHLNESSRFATPIFNFKYLKPTQQLLDEIINVWEALKHYKPDKHSLHGLCPDLSTETNVAPNCNLMLTAFEGIPSNCTESKTNSSCEFSPTEQQYLHDKRSKLISMLNEVDGLYGQYEHQMKILVSSFDRVAGCGAAKPYTALAMLTISRHFRRLRDTIMGQIRVTQKSLGDLDPSLNGGGITRLRYVDQKVKRQRVLKHLGVMQHVWRPQRGLPETAVSILRAWLFEHFLHPYPKDSEKTMLARLAGLTKSQVANWFINARVRLWKPMIEEMYEKEFNNSDDSSSTSHETIGEDLHERTALRATCGGHPQPCHEAHDFNFMPDIELNVPIAIGNFQDGAYGDQLQLQVDKTSYSG